MMKHLTILALMIIAIYSCNFSKTKSNDTQRKPLLINSTNEIQGNKLIQLKESLILNKTFYWVNETDSGEYILHPHGVSSPQKTVFSNNKMIFSGLENYSWIIDSIITSDKFLKIHVTDSYYLSDQAVYTVEPISNRQGFIKFNEVLYVDSAISKVNYTKEKPYDLNRPMDE